MTDVKLWLEYLKPFNGVQKRAQACLKMLSTKCVYELFDIYVLRFGIE